MATSTTIKDVREALANAVKSVRGLDRCTPYLPEQVNPPQAFIRLAVDYDLVMGRNGDTYNYTVVVIVSRTPDRASQALLDSICEPSGDTSLKTVVEADTALADLVDDVIVKSASDLRSIPIGAVDYLGIEFDVEVNY